jgi:hypothetical protein
MNFKINDKEYNVLITKDHKNRNVFYFYQAISLIDKTKKLYKVYFTSKGVLKKEATTRFLVNSKDKGSVMSSMIPDHGDEKVFQKFSITSDIDLILNEVNCWNEKEYFEKDCVTVFHQDRVYHGEVEKNKINGLGLMIYSSGDQYHGNWKNEVKYGLGIFTYWNGDKYHGNWKNEVKYGLGIFTYWNGDKYHGNWKDGVRSGFGVLIYANKDKYEGDWKGGVRNGFGVLIYANKDKYEGDWVDDEREGEGEFSFSNGQQYIGDWKSDEMNGMGTFIDTNKDGYNGEWKNGVIVPENKNKKKRSVLWIGSYELVKLSKNIKTRYNKVKIWVIFLSDLLEYSLDLKELVSERHNNQGCQVSIVINAHGGKKGTITDGKDIVNVLTRLLEKIIDFNQKNRDEKSIIKRIKLNLLVCYADKAIQPNGDLYGFIQKAVQNNIELRCSGVGSEYWTSALLINGKNGLPALNEKKGRYEIIETLFLPANSHNLESVKKDWQKKTYSEIEVIPDQDGMIICKGIKVYETMADFMDDIYQNKDKKVKIKEDVLITVPKK